MDRGPYLTPPIEDGCTLGKLPTVRIKSCFDCPLPICKHDLPDGPKVARRYYIKRLMKRGYTKKEIAEAQKKSV